MLGFSDRKYFIIQKERWMLLIRIDAIIKIDEGYWLEIACCYVDGILFFNIPIIRYGFRLAFTVFLL